jgi:ubiquinone/menaquinone biosynthesis C-methylase UbiE
VVDASLPDEPPRDEPPRDEPPRDARSSDAPSSDGPSSDGPSSDGPPSDGPLAGTRAAYDAVAPAYAAQFADELTAKPLDRALLECVAQLARIGRLADVGCGPGQVTRFLAEHHPDVIGIDLSARMLELAREQSPELCFEQASMLELPAADAAWAGLVAMYSLIHLDPTGRRAALAEFARVLTPGGWVLLAFHVDSAEQGAGQAIHLSEWFGHSVDLVTYLLDPADVISDLQTAGFFVQANLLRAPWSDAEEYPSRRCYLLAQRAAT